MKAPTTTQLLTFTLAAEVYAVDVNNAREVLEYSHITPIPKTPAWIRGVLNLRGSVVPVLDLKHKLGMGPTERSRDVCVIVLDIELDDERTLVGVLADGVREVIEVESSSIEPPPNFGARLSTEYIQGVGRRNEQLFIVLDIGKIFLASELELAQDTAEASASDGVPQIPIEPSTHEAAPSGVSAEAPV